MVYANGKVHRTGHIKLLPPSESWSSSKVEEIKATPWRLSPDEGDRDPPKVIPTEEQDEPEQEKKRADAGGA